MFLGEVETEISSSIASRFGVLGFGTSDTIWACGSLEQSPLLKLPIAVFGGQALEMLEDL